MHDSSVDIALGWFHTPLFFGGGENPYLMGIMKDGLMLFLPAGYTSGFGFKKASAVLKKKTQKKPKLKKKAVCESPLKVVSAWLRVNVQFGNEAEDSIHAQ